MLNDRLNSSIVALSTMLFAISVAACDKLQAGPLDFTVANSANSVLADVPMDTSTNWPLVEVMVNGKGPFWFIVDSGAMGTVVRNDLVEELGLPVAGRAFVKGPAGSGGYNADMVAIDTLAIGDRWSVSTQAVSLSSEQLPIPHQRIRGIVGFPLFNGLLLSFDYPAGRLTLERDRLPEPDGRRVVPMKRVARGRLLPSIAITVGSLEIDATVDTGNSRGLSLPSGMADSLPLESKPVKASSAELVGAVIELQKAVLDGSLHIGESEIERPTVFFTDAHGPNIGYEILRHYVITFDQANDRVRFVKGEAVTERRRVAVPAFSSRKRYGVRFYGLTGDTIEVVGVDPGSPAALAELSAGDIIVKINEQPVELLSPQQRAAALRSSPITFEYRRGSEIGQVSMSLED